MKKSSRLLITIFALMCVGFVIMTVLKERDTAKPASQCESLRLDQVGSERALGLVIQGRRLLSVRLASEKNYSPPGGHIEPGEGQKQALAREFVEELQIKLDLDKIQAYKVACAPKDGSIERTYYYRIDSLPSEPSLRNDADKVKYVSSDYSVNSKSDTELSQALYYLKSDGLID